MSRHGYDMDDNKFAAAIAASAHAIYSLEKISSHNQITKAKTRKEEIFNRATQAGSIGKPSGEDTKISPFVRPIPSFAEHQRQKETSWGRRNSNNNTEVWERTQIAKIRKRYEKMRSEIVAWENEKKIKEKHRMERRKSELELRKSRNLKHYQSKIARIDHIADGARSQLDEKRKHEESIVKEKARKIRATGKVPGFKYCFCF